MVETLFGPQVCRHIFLTSLGPAINLFRIRCLRQIFQALPKVFRQLDCHLQWRRLHQGSRGSKICVVRSTSRLASECGKAFGRRSSARTDKPCDRVIIPFHICGTGTDFLFRWKSLFGIGNFPKYINELDPEESAELLKKFYSTILDNHDLQVRFKWRNQNDIGKLLHGCPQVICCLLICHSHLGQPQRLPFSHF